MRCLGIFKVSPDVSIIWANVNQIVSICLVELCKFDGSVRIYLKKLAESSYWNRKIWRFLDDLLNSEIRNCAVAYWRQRNKPIRKVNIPLYWRQSSFLSERKDWPSKSIFKFERLVVQWHCLVHPEVIKLAGKINYCSEVFRVNLAAVLVECVNVKDVGANG